MAYRFPGIRAYVRADHVRPDFAAKVASEWFVSRAVDALSQLAPGPPEAREASLSQVEDALAALQCCRDAVEAALADARAGLRPDPSPTPEPTKEPPPEPPGKRRR